MADDQLVSLDEAMKELQIDQDGLKELFRQNSLRYVLEQGKIKIPRMALMALKIERMTSSTKQFGQMKRSKREKSAKADASAQTENTPTTTTPEENIPQKAEDMVSFDEALQLLGVDKSQLEEWAGSQRLRYVETKETGEIKFYRISLQAFKIHNVDIVGRSRPCKKKPTVRRVY